LKISLFFPPAEIPEQALRCKPDLWFVSPSQGSLLKGLFAVIQQNGYCQRRMLPSFDFRAVNGCGACGRRQET
ncbi:MAG: hypothetical protein ACKOCH_26510, partial [Bacteroidota bacterium]